MYIRLVSTVSSLIILVSFLPGRVSSKDRVFSLFTKKNDSNPPRFNLVINTMVETSDVFGLIFGLGVLVRFLYLTELLWLTGAIILAYFGLGIICITFDELDVVWFTGRKPCLTKKNE